MRGRANANFFKNAGANDFGGGGGEITIAAPKRNPNVDYAAQAQSNANNAASGSGAPASTKAIEAALKRAQQTGTLNMQGKGLPTFPMDLCKIHELQLIENWWEANPLIKVDLSNNEIESIPDEIAVQEVSTIPTLQSETFFCEISRLATTCDFNCEPRLTLNLFDITDNLKLQPEHK